MLIVLHLLVVVLCFYLSSLYIPVELSGMNTLMLLALIVVLICSDYFKFLQLQVIILVSSNNVYYSILHI